MEGIYAHRASPRLTNYHRLGGGRVANLAGRGSDQQTLSPRPSRSRRSCARRRRTRWNRKTAWRQGTPFRGEYISRTPPPPRRSTRSFKRGATAASNTVGYYPLPSTVAYQTSTLAQGATLDVIFSPWSAPRRSRPLSGLICRMRTPRFPLLFLSLRPARSVTNVQDERHGNLSPRTIFHRTYGGDRHRRDLYARRDGDIIVPSLR